MNIEEENNKLREENHKLKEKLEKAIQDKKKILEDKKKILEDKKKILEDKKKILEDKKKIEKEFEEFKAKHKGTVEELRKALKIKPDKKKKPLPSGAKDGHKAYTRHIPERIDYIRAHIPNKCPNCNTKLKGRAKKKRSRYITDIKLISEGKTTQHDIYRKYCPKCKKYVEGDVKEALPHANLGINLMLLIMFLKLGLRVSCEKISEYLLTCYNVKISKGGIIGVLKQLANAYGDYYSSLEKIVKIARVKHTDSTSWRIRGRPYYAWVFIACGTIIYKIRKRNNHKVALAMFGKKQKGIALVVDRHSAFRTLAEKAGFLLQLCWSHILADSKKLAKDFGAEGKYVHKKLKEIFAAAKVLRDEGTTEIVEQLKGEILQLTEKRYRHLTVGKFVRNLYHRDIENLFRFVLDLEIDPTNNISERELRALVIMRKITFGSGSRRGANATVMLMSIIQTLRFNKKNVLEGLHEILNNAA